MTVYGFVLLVHSYLRWAILVAAILVLARAFTGKSRGREWTEKDERGHAALVGLTNVQFLLGLLLYLVLSPITSAFFSGMPGSMKDSVLRFFGVEHVLAMLASIALLHIGRARSKRASTGSQRHSVVWRWTLASSVLLLAGIPWPFLKSGRPLLRGLSASAVAAPAPSAASASAAACPPSYQSRCAACHGGQGRGDGPAAASLDPRPRDFADSTWARGRTDAEIAGVIRDGGAAHGLSAVMPPHADLGPAEIDSLVACVRTLQKR